MYYLTTEHTFDSAHFLKDYEGKCKNLHGHCWKVMVTVCADTLQEKGAKRGMLVDFSDLKEVVCMLCDELDHCLIYEAGSLQKETVNALLAEQFRLVEIPFRPTAENFAKYFYDRVKEAGLPVCRTEVYETEKNCAIYEASAVR